MDELTKRNFNALSEGLKQLRSDMSELQIENKTKDEQIQQLRTQVDTMSSRYGIIMAKVQGTGATVC